HLLDLDAERLTETELRQCVATLPSGAKALFAPQKVDEFKEIQPAQAEAIIRSATRMAEYVIVDLSSQISAVTESAVRECDQLTVVVERNSVCVAAGSRLVRLLKHWHMENTSIAAVVVIRDALAGFM